MVGVFSQGAVISVIYELRQCAIALATDWVHGRAQITQSSTYVQQLEQSLWFAYSFSGFFIHFCMHLPA